MFQAVRASDYSAVFLMDDDRVGELVESGPTSRVFESPGDPRAKAYVSRYIS
jgi:phosphate transport system ATP-binding protein